MKEDKKESTDPEEVPIEEGREITMAGSKENKYGGKTHLWRMILLRSQPFFPLSFLTQVVFLSHAL